ncbi:gfo/Idh/MocA family oxidoreductase [Phragmitibacter flavus]|uniref:Gfo/Idh/MocA family oxidoreductase n=1 Tax=Phragmitibacter flavus TaxID=2576071 RepID=A0A5R8K898_9BACT|nr:Gfo/Idh/MocA family oxidoreductase [Phragmitibacter flavus]TLD68567.1 gfo/Idh/MocA family oxidoreductase [Phragmitibacter flavus]
MPRFLAILLLFFTSLPLSAADPIRAGIIGLDTSHAVAFTTTLNQGPKKPEDAPKFAGVKVIAAYPQGSKDIPSSIERVPEYTEKLKAMGVTIVDSIEALLPLVDVIFLESNDGRVHLEQIRPVLKAGKPVFIDKPVGGSLADVLTIYAEAKQAGVPIFSSSSLRYGKNTQLVRNGSIGLPKTAFTHSPAKIEPTHPDLFWYGIHGVESLVTTMGPGCLSVKRGTTPDGLIQVTGTWPDHRTGTFMESNTSDRKGYGGKATSVNGEAPVGGFDTYDPLLVEIVKFFKTRKSPVSDEETIEIYAFMEAADESKRQNGAEVTLQSVIEKATVSLAK